MPLGVWVGRGRIRGLVLAGQRDDKSQSMGLLAANSWIQPILWGTVLTHITTTPRHYVFQGSPLHTPALLTRYM